MPWQPSFRAAPSTGVVSLPIITGLNLLASVDGVVNCLFLVHTRSTLFALQAWLSQSAYCCLPVATMLPGLIGYAHTHPVGVTLLPMSYT